MITLNFPQPFHGFQLVSRHPFINQINFGLDNPLYNLCEYLADSSHGFSHRAHCCLS